MMARYSIKSLDDVERYLLKLVAPSVDYGDRIKYVQHVLHELGDPQDTIRAIHIAGTSGKGSTAYYAASLLCLSGYTVGLCVSPHVHRVTERAQVNGEPLSDAEYVKYFNIFKAEVETRNFTLSYIQFLDIFMFWLFSRLKLDYIVIEVGLGGLLDPTNVMTRSDKICVITDIGLDHMEILGNTLAAIAEQKAGIIHDHNDVIMHKQSNQVVDVVKAVAVVHNAPLRVIERSVHPVPKFLQGFQRRNWTLAYSAVALRLKRDGKSDLDPAQDDRSAAITIPGRFEKVLYNGAQVVLDAAHNPQKIEALTLSLTQQYPDKSFVCVVSFAQNKATSFVESLKLLQKLSSTFIVTELHVNFGTGHSAIPAQVLKNEMSNETIVIADPAKAFTAAINLANDTDKIVVVTGSFYLIDTIRRIAIAEY